MPEEIATDDSPWWRDEAVKKGACFVLAALAVLAPFLVSLPGYWRIAQGTIVESSTYALDIPLYFRDLFHQRSFFEEGQHSVWLLQYAAWYWLQGAFHLVMPGAAAYVVLVACFFLLGTWFFVKLLCFIANRDDKPATVEGWAAACLLAILYFSSLSIYNFLQNNIFFALPYLILPALLYWSLRYVHKSDAIALLLFTFCALLLSDLNVFHDIIIIVCVNFFVAIMWRRDRTSPGALMRRAAMVNAALLPGFVWLLTSTAGHATYLGRLSDFAKVSAEQMYSASTSYLSIFLQQTDWQLFDSWNGRPYYDFAYTYANSHLWAFGFAPFVLLAAAGFLSRASRAQRRVALWLLIGAMVAFVTMFGTTNVVYRILYANITAFQIFRNITKLAPLLYLLVLASAYVFLYGRLKERTVGLLAALLIACSLVYNVPYWSYGAKTFDIRTIRELPAYWRAAANYLDVHARPGSRVLVLPATYIYELHHWNNRTVAVQGDLLDVLLPKVETYRLSERLVGSINMQEDENHAFVPSNRSVRSLDTDYERLTEIARKYGLNYVILTRDTVSEYQHTPDILRWLSVNGYIAIANYGPVEIFEKPENRLPEFVGADAQFRQVNPLRFEAVLPNFKGTRTITLGVPYNAGWTLEVERYRPLGKPDSFGGSPLQEIQALFKPFAFARSHRSDEHYANVWTIRSNDIIRDHTDWYGRDTRKPIDLRLGFYFRPQAYTYIGALIATVGFACVLLVEIVIIALRREMQIVSRAGVIAASCTAAAAIVIFPPLLQRSAQANATASPGTMSPPGAYIHTLTTNAAKTVRFEIPGADKMAFAASGCQESRRLLNLDLLHGRNTLAVRVRPQAPVRCTLTVEARSRASHEPVSVAYVYVNAEPPISTNGGAATAASLTFPSPAAAMQQVNIVGGMTGNWFYLEHAGSCEGVATVGLEERRQGSPSDVSAQVLVQPLQAGVCAFKVRQSDAVEDPVSITIRVMGGLSLSPVRPQRAAHYTFYGPHTGLRTLDVYKKFGPVPLNLGVYGGDCSTVAGFYPRPISDGSGLAHAQLVIDPVTPGNCTALIGGQYGLDGGPLTVHITVLPLSVRDVGLHAKEL